MCKVVDLRDDLVETIDFLDDNLVKILPEIGVVETFRQQLCESLDGDEGISDFVRHAGREIGPKR